MVEYGLAPACAIDVWRKRPSIVKTSTPGLQLVAEFRVLRVVSAGDHDVFGSVTDPRQAAAASPVRAASANSALLALCSPEPASRRCRTRACPLRDSECTNNRSLRSARESESFSRSPLHPSTWAVRADRNPIGRDAPPGNTTSFFRSRHRWPPRNLQKIVAFAIAAPKIRVGAAQHGVDDAALGVHRQRESPVIHARPILRAVALPGFMAEFTRPRDGVKLPQQLARARVIGACVPSWTGGRSLGRVRTHQQQVLVIPPAPNCTAPSSLPSLRCRIPDRSSRWSRSGRSFCCPW